MNPWTKFVQNISAKLAFFPPMPTYEVLEHKDGTGQLYIQPKYSELPRVLSCTVKKLTPKQKRRGGGGGDEIVAAFIPYTPRNGTKRVDTTILYSHGNAVDLGQLMPFYKDLSRALKVNIMAYDYSGYGASKGQATVQNTLADVEAVYTCLLDDFGLQPSHIIAYGQSVGSGPTAWLAATYKGLAGVVMHTPLLSGIRVLNPNLKWWPSWADVYPNHLLVSKIDCPVLVLHGTEDEVIHFSHGKRMHELARNKVDPLWAIGYNHQNLELCPQYLPRLRKFISDLSPTSIPQQPPSPLASSPPACDVPIGQPATPAGASSPTTPFSMPHPSPPMPDNISTDSVPIKPLLLRPSRTESLEVRNCTPRATSTPPTSLPGTPTAANAQPTLLSSTPTLTTDIPPGAPSPLSSTTSPTANTTAPSSPPTLPTEAPFLPGTVPESPNQPSTPTGERTANPPFYGQMPDPPTFTPTPQPAIPTPSTPSSTPDPPFTDDPPAISAASPATSSPASPSANPTPVTPTHCTDSPKFPISNDPGLLEPLEQTITALDINTSAPGTPTNAAATPDTATTTAPTPPASA